MWSKPSKPDGSPAYSPLRRERQGQAYLLHLAHEAQVIDLAAHDVRAARIPGAGSHRLLHRVRNRPFPLAPRAQRV